MVDGPARRFGQEGRRVTKDAWIQKAKALLFDVDASGLVDGYCLLAEARELILEGGGYDPATESGKTPLRWPAVVDDA